MSFLFTLANGVLGLYLIAAPQSKLAAIVDSYVFNAKFTAALAVLVAPGLTATTLLSAIGLLWNFGMLGDVFWLAFSSLSWWAAGKVMVYLLSLVATGPVPTPQQALFVLNCGSLVYSLNNAINGYSAACGPQSPDRPADAGHSAGPAYAGAGGSAEAS